MQSHQQFLLEKTTRIIQHFTGFLTIIPIFLIKQNNPTYKGCLLKMYEGNLLTYHLNKYTTSYFAYKIKKKIQN